MRTAKSESTSVKTNLRYDLISKNGKKRIEFLLYFNYKQYRISSGKSIEPKYWIKTQECVDKKSDEASEINQVLSGRLEKFEKYVNLKKALEKPLVLEEMKIILKGEDLEPEIANGEEPVLPTISEVFDLFLKESDPKRKGTVTNYIVTNKILVDFCLKKYKKEVRINEVNYSFLNNFKNYLRTGRSKPNNKNTIAKRLKIFFTILKFAVDSELLVKNPMQGFKIEHGEPRDTALTEKEYQSFRALKLPKSACPSMILTRFMFVFCCETGVRYSDAQDLKWEHVNPEIKAFSKKQVKTSKNVYVPLSNQAKAILIKYRNTYQNSEGYVFPRIDNQVMNRYLKEIAKLVGITKNLTTHVARHTFGTHLGASGVVSAFTISELMGHSDIGMTQRYIDLSKFDLNNAMERVWEQRIQK